MARATFRKDSKSVSVITKPFDFKAHSRMLLSWFLAIIGSKTLLNDKFPTLSYTIVTLLPYECLMV